MTSYMKVRATVRRFGNSLGVVIPTDEAERQGIAAGDEVELEVERKVNLKELFGSLKFSKTAQEMKDEDREAWGHA